MPESAIASNTKGNSRLLADAVTKAMEDRGWSIRAAAAYTGLAENTVDRMKKGIGVEPDALIIFGKAVAESGNEIATARKLLKLGGKDQIVSLIDDVERSAGTVPLPIQTLSPNGQTVAIMDEKGENIFFEASPELIALISSLIKAIQQQRH